MRPRALGVETALNQVSKQRLRDAAVLGVAFPNAQNLLLPPAVDAQSDQDQMVSKVDAIDHHDGKVTIAQRRRQPGRHLLRRHRHAPS